MDSITIGGKEYKFKAEAKKLKTLRDVAKLEVQIDGTDTLKLLTDDETFEKFSEIWDKYCDLVFEPPDNGLELVNLSLSDLPGIKSGFFGFAVGSRAS